MYLTIIFYTELERIKTPLHVPHLALYIFYYYSNVYPCCVPAGALTKVKESQKHVEEGKMERQQADGIAERCNIISFATLAEIQHFHQIRVRDFKAQMQHYLQQQISFFQKVTGKLEEALRQYDNA